MRKRIKCNVCGAKVVPKREKTIARRDGGISWLFCLQTYIDVMDCPRCGCQIALNGRAEAAPEDETEGSI